MSKEEAEAQPDPRSIACAAACTSINAPWSIWLEI